MTNAEQEIVIIGWHDGIIEALLQAEDGRWMFASMIAWNPERKLRIFGLVEADDDTAAEIRALSTACTLNAGARDDAWAALRSRLAAFLKQVRGNAELRLCDELDGEMEAALQVEAREIVSLLGREIEATLNSRLFAEMLARLRSQT